MKDITGKDGQPLTVLQTQILKILEANKQYNTTDENYLRKRLKIQKKSQKTDVNENNRDFRKSAKSSKLFHHKDMLFDQYVKPSSSGIGKDFQNKFPYTEISQLNLLTPLKVPISITSAEILKISKKKSANNFLFSSVLNTEIQSVYPPLSSKLKKVPMKCVSRVPCIDIDCIEDIQKPENHLLIQNSPITLVKGLDTVLNLDLAVFSTKTLLLEAADHKIEMRTQHRMPSHLNVDRSGNETWKYYSSRESTTILKYAKYMAKSFRRSIHSENDKNRVVGAKFSQTTTTTSESDSKPKRRKLVGGEEIELPLKLIRFGTNLDLSDAEIWKRQLREIAKTDTFCKAMVGTDMLGHLGYDVLGMNTVQLYMKVPGSRTPAHLENNNFASINMNIGPGDCEWYGCPYEYWGVIEKLCEKHGIDFLRGSYWPNVEELLANGVPVFKFVQKPGELVWISAGCVHWVQALGWCNNVAWNVGPLNAKQLKASIISYEWNKTKKFKSLIPLQHLSWQLARNLVFDDVEVFEIVRSILIRSLSFTKRVADYAVAHGKKIYFQDRNPKEAAHYCEQCQVEVFNILFGKKDNEKYIVFCVHCAISSGLDEFVVIEQHKIEDLSNVYDKMVLKSMKEADLP